MSQTGHVQGGINGIQELGNSGPQYSGNNMRHNGGGYRGNNIQQGRYKEFS